MRYAMAGAAACACVLLTAHAADAPQRPAWVTAERIGHADAEPQNWLTVGRDY